ncbi:MAG: hypothetical protein IKP46_02860 [Bacteroidales bacterium]|nr:hypothetical protein [Bacteroidales bacterium]
MKKIFFAILLIAVAFSSCKKNREKENGGDSPKPDYSVVLAELNENIVSLQSVVEALRANDYLTEVHEAVDLESGDVIGYELVFANSGSHKIYHGKKGTEGQPLAIGIDRDTDGLYYWTLDGEWLILDEEKILAAGNSGAGEVVTPKVNINGSAWYISYGKSAAWIRLGTLSGVPSSDIFSDVRSEDDFLILELGEGVVYNIPIGSSSRLVITHSLRTFSVPSITGNTARGLVEWGDGAMEDWTVGMSHNYSSGASHSVVITMKDIYNFSLGNLTGITEIDASEL